MKRTRALVLGGSLVATLLVIACSSDTDAPIPGGDDSGTGNQNDASTFDGTVAQKDSGNGSQDAGANDAGNSGDSSIIDAGHDAGGPLVPDASGLTGELFHYGHFQTTTANSFGHFSFPTVAEHVLALGGSDVTAWDVAGDGSKILYGTDATLKGRFDLHLANADGTGATLVAALTNAGRTVSLARFSPDKTSAAFVSDDVTLGAKDVYYAPTSGATAPVLISPARGGGTATKLNADQVVFSRDGRYIAISGDYDIDNVFELWIYDTQTTTLTQIVNTMEAGNSTGSPVGVTDPISWDANGNLYFTASLGTDGAPSSFKLYMASVANGKQIVPGTQTTNMLEQAGSFGISADGNTLAVSLTDATGAYPYALYTLPAGGGTLTALFDATYTYLNPTTANPDFSKPLVFSPDGTKIAFDADYQGANADYELFVVSTVTNSKPVRLFKVTPGASRDTKWIAWALGSTRVAFTSDQGASGTGNAQLFLTNDIATPDQTLSPIVPTPSGGGLVSAPPHWVN